MCLILTGNFCKFNWRHFMFQMQVSPHHCGNGNLDKWFSLYFAKKWKFFLSLRLYNFFFDPPVDKSSRNWYYIWIYTAAHTIKIKQHHILTHKKWIKDKFIFGNQNGTNWQQKNLFFNFSLLKSHLTFFILPVLRRCKIIKKKTNKIANFIFLF